MFADFYCTCLATESGGWGGVCRDTLVPPGSVGPGQGRIYAKGVPLWVRRGGSRAEILDQLLGLLIARLFDEGQ